MLPVPLVNLINGGKHASNDLDFQEFIVIPVGADSILEALQISTEVNLALAEILLERYGKSALNTGDEGGYAPAISSPQEALGLLHEAVADAGHDGPLPLRPRLRRHPLLRPRSGPTSSPARPATPAAMIELYLELIRDFDVVTIEDPLDEEDFDGLRRADRGLAGSRSSATTCSSPTPSGCARGIDADAANSLLWKVNQIGTLSEALDAAELAHRSAYSVVVSERSGETEDPIIADLAVALGAGQIKTGRPGPRRADRQVQPADPRSPRSSARPPSTPATSFAARRSPPEMDLARRPSQPPDPRRRARAGSIGNREALLARGLRRRASSRCASPRPGSPPATGLARPSGWSRLDGDELIVDGVRHRARPGRPGARASAPARPRWGSPPRSSGSSASASTAGRSPSATAPRRGSPASGSRCSSADHPLPSERSVAAARRLLEHRRRSRRARPRDRLLHRRQLGAREPAARRRVAGREARPARAAARRRASGSSR